MNRLQKFIEQGVYGEKAGRTAYAFGPDNLPEPNKNMEWKPAAPFSPPDELMADTGIKEVFEVALRKGFAIVEPRSTKT